MREINYDLSFSLVTACSALSWNCISHIHKLADFKRPKTSGMLLELLDIRYMNHYISKRPLAYSELTWNFFLVNIYLVNKTFKSIVTIMIRYLSWKLRVSGSILAIVVCKTILIVKNEYCLLIKLGKIDVIFFTKAKKQYIIY